MFWTLRHSGTAHLFNTSNAKGNSAKTGSNHSSNSERRNFRPPRKSYGRLNSEADDVLPCQQVRDVGLPHSGGSKLLDLIGSPSSVVLAVPADTGGTGHSYFVSGSGNHNTTGPTHHNYSNLSNNNYKQYQSHGCSSSSSTSNKHDHIDDNANRCSPTLEPPRFDCRETGRTMISDYCTDSAAASDNQECSNNNNINHNNSIVLEISLDAKVQSQRLKEQTLLQMHALALSDNDDDDESHTCNVCDRAFGCHRQLASHQQKKRHFGCSGCDSLFQSFMLLEHHKEEFEHWSDYEEAEGLPCCRKNRRDDSDYADTESGTSTAESEDLERLL